MPPNHWTSFYKVLVIKKKMLSYSNLFCVYTWNSGYICNDFMPKGTSLLCIGKTEILRGSPLGSYEANGVCEIQSPLAYY